MEMEKTMYELLDETKQRTRFAETAMRELINSNLIVYFEHPTKAMVQRVTDEDRVKMVADLSVKFADALMERLAK